MKPVVHSKGGASPVSQTEVHPQLASSSRAANKWPANGLSYLPAEQKFGLPIWLLPAPDQEAATNIHLIAERPAYLLFYFVVRARV